MPLLHKCQTLNRDKNSQKLILCLLLKFKQTKAAKHSNNATTYNIHFSRQLRNGRLARERMLLNITILFIIALTFHCQVHHYIQSLSITMGSNIHFKNDYKYILVQQSVKCILFPYFLILSCYLQVITTDFGKKFWQNRFSRINFKVRFISDCPSNATSLHYFNRIKAFIIVLFHLAFDYLLLRRIQIISCSKRGNFLEDYCSPTDPN